MNWQSLCRVRITLFMAIVICVSSMLLTTGTTIFVMIGWRAHWPMPKFDGLICVTILDKLQDAQGKTWYLLETDDGQRGYIDYYRGRPGQGFTMAADEIKGYRRHPTEVDLGNKITLPPPVKK